LNDLKQEDTKLTEKQFEIIFGRYFTRKGKIEKVSKGLCGQISKKFFHMYKVPQDTTENYISEIISENKSTVKSLLEQSEGKAKLVNYLNDRLRTREYLNIMRVKTKDINEVKYKIFVNIKVKKDTDKFNLLNEIQDEISKMFSVETRNIYDINKNENKDLFFLLNSDEIIYKVMLYGKPSKAFLDREDLEIEVESIINNIETIKIKVQDIDIKVIDRFRKSLYYDLDSIDFSESDFIDLIDKKTLFYSVIDEFGLTESEKTFINLTFQGYNVYKDSDIDIFKEAMKKDSGELLSSKYLRNRFISILCDKLKENSPFNDFEVTHV